MDKPDVIYIIRNDINNVLNSNVLVMECLKVEPVNSWTEPNVISFYIKKMKSFWFSDTQKWIWIKPSEPVHREVLTAGHSCFIFSEFTF